MRIHRLLVPWLAALACAGCPAEGGGTATKPSAEAAASAKPLNLPGIDTNALSPRERREFAAQVRELLAPCPDVPVSLAQCLEEKRSCAACKPATDMLLRMVQKGVPKKDLQKAADQFKEASLKGDTSSMYYYAQCLLNGWGVSANLEEATKWFHDAAVAGDPEAGEWCKKNKVEYEMKKRALPE